MITKDNLVGMLKKSLYNEDGFVEQHSKSFAKDVDMCGELKEDEKRELKDMFQVMLDDTRRHGKVITELIEKIKKDKKNEY